jgi:FkbM family methyltransferase
MSEKKIGLIPRIVLKLTANSFAQKLLDRNIRRAHYLMGVGFGAHTGVSGEENVLKNIIASFKNDYCIFDVGANRAQFANLILKVAEPAEYKLDLHCFEPSKTTLEIFKKNILNEDSLILNNIGLGKNKETLTLYNNSPGSGWGSLTKRRLDHFNKSMDLTEEVQIDTLDNYCKEKKIESIDLLKIDVEGHELDVLSGGKDTFSKKKVKNVMFEFGGCNIDTRTFFQDFFYFFQENDMDIYRITPTGYLHPIDKYQEILEQFRTTNYLASSSGKS